MTVPSTYRWQSYRNFSLMIGIGKINNFWTQVMNKSTVDNPGFTDTELWLFFADDKCENDIYHPSLSYLYISFSFRIRLGCNLFYKNLFDIFFLLMFFPEPKTEARFAYQKKNKRSLGLLPIISQTHSYTSLNSFKLKHSSNI